MYLCHVELEFTFVLISQLKINVSFDSTKQSNYIVDLIKFFENKAADLFCMQKYVNNRWEQLREKYRKFESQLTNILGKEDVNTFIEKNFSNKYIKLILLFLVRKTTILTVTRIYLCFVGGFILEKLPIWKSLANVIIPDRFPWKNKLILFVGDLFSSIDPYIIGIVTIGFVFGLIAYLLSRYINLKLEQEATKQMEFFGFKAEHSWFIQNNEIRISQIGPRYSKSVNFKNPNLYPIYEGVIEDVQWRQDYHDYMQRFLFEAKKMYDNKSEDIKKADYVILKSIETIKDAFNNKSKSLFELIQDAQNLYDEFEKANQESRRHDEERHYDDLSKLYSHLSLLKGLEIPSKLDVRPLLHITGQAGMGKTHFLADLVLERQKKGKFSVLLLGCEFVDDNTSVQKQIEQILDLKCGFSDWLDSLNQFAIDNNQKVFIIIDGINEGKGETIWADSLRAFETDVLNRSHLGLILSARTFINNNLLNQYGLPEAITFQHRGFEGIIDEAIDYFMTAYKLPANVYNMFVGDVANPLFLKTYCEAFDEERYGSIKTLLDIIECFMDKVNSKLIKELNLPKMLNCVNQAMYSLADMSILQKGKCQLYHKYEDVLFQFSSILPKSIDKDKFIEHLISEGLLICVKDYHSNINYIHYNYELVGSYLIAKRLIDRDDWSLSDILENYILEEPYTLLLPALKNQEILNLRDSDCSFDKKEQAFIQTLEHRLSMTQEGLFFIKDKLNNRDKCIIEIMPQISSLTDCYDVFKQFNQWMLSLSLTQRDCIWTIPISKVWGNTIYYVFAKNVFSMSSNRLRQLSDEQVFQIGSVLIWTLSLVYLPSRDIATKALTHLLKYNLNCSTDLLEEFKQVNDPYISQRLYAAVFGAVMQSKPCEPMIKIAHFTFENVFNKDQVPTDILLRDYARNIIFYISQYYQLDGIDISKINPPYKSHSFNESDCPDYKEIQDKYEPCNNKRHYTKEELARVAILDSMRTEHSLRGMYGDFGRYTFGAAVHYWIFNDELASNYAIKLIFEKYGYDSKLFENFDNNVYRGRSRDNRIERIGKKYQWIAFYEVLALLADNVPFRQEYEWESDQYYGTWEPCVRDIDPTSSFISDVEETRRYEQLPRLNWIQNNMIPFEIQNRKNWLYSDEGMHEKLFRYQIELKDDKGEEWISLFSYNVLYENNLNLESSGDDICGLWVFIQSYIVPKSCNSDVMNYIDRVGNYGRNMPEHRNPIYSLFYKDYYNTFSYKEYRERFAQEESDNFNAFIPLGNNNPDWDKMEFAYIYISPNGGRSCYRLCQTLFEGLELTDGNNEGEYVDSEGRIIAMDISVNYHNKTMLLVRRKELKEFLENNNLTIVWPLLAEKQFGYNYIYGGQFGGCLSWDGSKWESKIRFYHR